MNNNIWNFINSNLLYLLLTLGAIILFSGCGGIQPEPHVTLVLTRSFSTQPTSLPSNILDTNGNSVEAEQPTIVAISPKVFTEFTKTPSSNPSNTLVPDRMTETPIPTIFEVENELLIDVSTDFLYIAGGSLYLFDHQKKSISLLLSPTLENSPVEADLSVDCSSLHINEIVIDKLNKTAAILVDKGITANGIEQFMICSYLFESREVYPLIDNIPRPSELSISPDGKWITYIDISQSRKIVLIPSEQTESMQILAICSGSRCNRGIWSTDSRFLLWSDKSGIWQLDVTSGEKENIQPGIVQVSDQYGEQIDLPVIYQPIAWSPAGRYVSVGIRPERSDVQWVGLLDTKTSRMIEIPGTHSYPEDAAVHTWNNDGTLTTIQFIAENEEDSLEIITYKIVPTHTDLMITTAIETFTIPKGFSIIDNTHSQSLRLYNLNQHTSGTYSLLLVTDSPVSNSWLVELDDQEQMVKVITEVPSDLRDILWSSDSKKVIILGRHGERLIIADSQDTLKDLRFHLGDDIKDIHWLSVDVQFEQ